MNTAGGSSRTPLFAEADLGRQQALNARFTAEHEYWKRLYEERTLFGIIHQRRREMALRWIEKLYLPAGTRVLDVGCGAGIVTVDLARRRYVVDAVDTSEAMVRLCGAEARRADVTDRVTTAIGDAHALQFASGSHRLVVALGVIPFVHSPVTVLSEMARVLEPGGSVVLSSDNRYRLNYLLDVRFNPALVPFKRLALSAARRIGIASPATSSVPLGFATLAKLLTSAGFEMRRCVTLGFGPFTLLGRGLLSEGISIQLHERLQSLADRGLPVLRGLGAQHLVLARRRGSTPARRPRQPSHCSGVHS